MKFKLPKSFDSKTKKYIFIALALLGIAFGAIEADSGEIFNLIQLLFS